MSEQRQPRVLHIGKYLPPVPGGIETYLGDLLRVSMRHGLEVGAVVHGKKGYPDPNPADFGGAKIYTVPTYGQVLYAPVAPMFPWVLRKAIREFKPDILHMHVPNTSAFWALFIPEARKIPWVLHWHADVESREGSRAFTMAYNIYRQFETRLLSRSIRIIATSLRYADSSRQLASAKNKVVIRPLAVDANRLESVPKPYAFTARDFWPHPRGLRLLVVGRATFYKSSKILAEAVESLGDRASLIVVSSGQGRDEKKIARNSHVTNVRVVSDLDQEELFALYEAADILCFSVQSRAEAFGLVLLEASYFGCSVLVSDEFKSGAGWVVERLENGVSLKNNETSSWVQALNLLSAKPQRNPSKIRGKIPSIFLMDRGYIERLYFGDED